MNFKCNENPQILQSNSNDIELDENIEMYDSSVMVRKCEFSPLSLLDYDRLQYSL